MSIDELSYAGGEYWTDLTAPYVWYYTNANGESITGYLQFWALSPGYWLSSGSVVWGVGDPGYLYYYVVGNSFAVRPQVSLLSCNLTSRGDGSPENPYVVYTGSGSC